MWWKIGLALAVVCIGVALVLGLTATPPAARHGTLVLDDAAGVVGDGRSQLETAAYNAPFDVVVLTRNSGLTDSQLSVLVKQADDKTHNPTVLFGLETGVGATDVQTDGVSVEKVDIDSALGLADPRFIHGDWTAGLVAATNRLADAARTHKQNGEDLPSYLPLPIGFLAVVAASVVRVLVRRKPKFDPHFEFDTTPDQ